MSSDHTPSFYRFYDPVRSTMREAISVVLRQWAVSFIAHRRPALARIPFHKRTRGSLGPVVSARATKTLVEWGPHGMSGRDGGVVPNHSEPSASSISAPSRTRDG